METTTKTQNRAGTSPAEPFSDISAPAPWASPWRVMLAHRQLESLCCRARPRRQAGRQGAARSVPDRLSTPYTPDDKLDLECLANEVKFCNKGGVHGLAWPQIASGWTSLKEDERWPAPRRFLATGKGGKTALVIGVQSQDGNMADGRKIRQARRRERRRCDRVAAAAGCFG